MLVCIMRSTVAVFEALNVPARWERQYCHLEHREHCRFCFTRIPISVSALRWSSPSYTWACYPLKFVSYFSTLRLRHWTESRSSTLLWLKPWSLSGFLVHKVSELLWSLLLPPEMSALHGVQGWLKLNSATQKPEDTVGARTLVSSAPDRLVSKLRWWVEGRNF